MIREIRYSVSKDGISPAGRQFGGVQSEHKRMRVYFDLPAEIFEEVEALQENGGNGYYRFEVYNGAGEVFRTASVELYREDASKICYTLEERDTRYGGIVHVVLSITAMNAEGTEWEMYTFPAELKFKNKPDGVASDGKSRIPYSELELKALEASDTALKVKQAYDNGELKGEKGDIGEKGDTGPQGEKGDTGPKGDKGDAGAIKFIPVTELPIENIDESAIYLLPSNNPEEKNGFNEFVYSNGAWEMIGSASVEINLDEYVKNTDLATSEKAGLVQIGNGLTLYKGKLQVQTPSGALIASRSMGCPITPSELDIAVKHAITGYKTFKDVGSYGNQLPLTDEEKAVACNWLGVIKTIEPNEEGKYFCNLSEMQDGIYVLPEGTNIQYRASGTNRNVYGTTFAFITTKNNGNKQYFAFEDATVVIMTWGGYADVASLPAIPNTNKDAQYISGGWTFSGNPKITGTLAADDNSTNIPNTQWVNAAIDEKVKTLNLDYVVEQGTADGWIYRKWNSGIVECWGKKSYDYTTSGEHNYQVLVNAFYFPDGLFIEPPNIQISTIGLDLVKVIGHGLTTKGCSLYIETAYAASGTVQVEIFSIGKWK